MISRESPVQVHKTDYADLISAPESHASVKDRDLNAIHLSQELAWFNEVLNTRINLYFSAKSVYQNIYEVVPPKLQGESDYSKLVNKYSMNFEERLILILVLIPHIAPQALEILFTRNTNLDRNFCEFGGWKGKSHGGFLPTIETGVFLLAGNDLNKRFQVDKLFQSDHYLIYDNIIKISHSTTDEPFYSSTVKISDHYLRLFSTGANKKPQYSTSFPAKHITSKLTWNDLVLPDGVLADIKNIVTWIKQSTNIMSDWGLEKNIKPGYRSLFYGPPGTGKTLTATLIGQAVNADVFRIDISMVVSKYVGETEKNLANVFDQAENKDWILFFDEADALFGKRSQASSANDRYSNQEVSYLLQRIEDFPGTVILASNLKDNIDEAFSRRFQSLIYFPMPSEDQRFELWRSIFKNSERLGKDVDLKIIAHEYEISGGAICNVARYAVIQALERGEDFLNQYDLIEGIMKERMKEGRTA